MAEAPLTSAPKSYPIFFEGGAMVLGVREKEFLEYFLACGDTAEAAEKSGMKIEHAREFMGSARIKGYVASKIEQIGRRNDVTLDSVLDRLHKVAWGDLKITRYEMKALEILASYLGILKPAVQVAVGVKVEQPLSSIPDDKLDEMLASRAAVIKAEVE